MSSFENQEQQHMDVQMQQHAVGGDNEDNSGGHMNGDEAQEGDINLECRDCGYSFLFTAGEQEFYRTKDFEGPPTRCKPCRAQKKASRDSHKQHDVGNGGGFGGPMNYMMMDAYGNPINMFPYQQQQRPSNLRTKPCHAFQRGDCSYGAECRYYHDDGSQGPPGQYLHQQQMGGGGFPGGGFPQGGGGMYMGDPSMGGGMFPAGGSPHQGGGGNYSPRNTHGQHHHRGHKSRNPCFAFQRGECTYGDTCRYLHVDASTMTDASGMPIVVHPHLPRGYCHAFARGQCKYGDTCKFRHEVPPGGGGAAFNQQQGGGNQNPNPNMT